ncbi:MAG: MFS transporter [Thermoanaerobaculia bacterium]
MKKHLVVLFASLFVVMIGFGITLPVLPFYVERLAVKGGGSRAAVVLHVGLLTGVYALMQFVFAPVWGRLSDRTGRRPLVLFGIGGYVVSQVLFGLSMSLWLLYVARVLGGILSSATLPASAAYVADMTGDDERGRGMAWLGAAVSLGFVVGPALGGMLTLTDFHFRASFGHFRIDAFSVPFFAAAALGVLTLFAAMRWLPESLPAHPALRSLDGKANVGWRDRAPRLGPLLGLTLAAQLALAMFEATFPLYAQSILRYGPGQVAAVFVVCGLVMTVCQVWAVNVFAGRLAEMWQIAAGFGVMGLGLGLLVLGRSKLSVFVFVGILALGLSFISPNLAALISKRGGRDRVGQRLGAQNAANSLGQAIGPLLGGALFLWQARAAYIVSSSLLLIVALLVSSWATQHRGPGKAERLES